MLLIDIGGTTTRVSAARVGGGLLPPVLFGTEPDIDAGIARIAHEAKKFLEGKSPKIIVAGIAGQVSKEGVLLKGPNLPGWEGHSLRDKLSSEFGAPAHVVNDALLGGLGEAHKGAGVGATSLLYMTFGTGIGACRIVSGKPDFSLGTETGHQYISYGDALVEAEDLISGKAFKNIYGKGGEDIKDHTFWKEHARLAAIVVFNTSLHFLPDTVVLGGSLMKEGSLSAEDIELRLAEIGRRLSPFPKVLLGTLGDFAGLHGAHAYGTMLLS